MDSSSRLALYYNHKIGLLGSEIIASISLAISCVISTLSSLLSLFNTALFFVTCKQSGTSALGK